MTDASLVERTVAGDLSAFEALYARHCRFVRHFVQGRTHVDDVDDVLQIAWLRAFRALARFDGRSQFRTWVCKIAINHIIDESRRAMRIHTDPGIDLADVPYTYVVSRAPSAEMQLRYRAALDALESVPHGQYLWLVGGLGWTFEELAIRERVPLSTVKTRYYRARTLARESLGAAA